MTRDELLRQLLGAAPGPENPERILILPTEEEVKDILPPAEARDFGIRRQALFDEMMSLFDLGTGNLREEQFCRYQLLALLFRNGKSTVGEAWQPVLALRGAEALRTFETALALLLQSGCVEIRNPE